jgi:hypothetical protein
MRWQSIKTRAAAFLSAPQIENLPPQEQLTVQVASREVMEQYRPTTKHVCISITNPGELSIPLPSGWREVLNVSFEDTEDKHAQWRMSRADAKRVLDFARRNADATVVVHGMKWATASNPTVGEADGRALSIGVFLACWLGRQIVLSRRSLQPNHFVMRRLRWAAVGRAVRWADASLIQAAASTPEGPLSKASLYAMMPRAIADTYPGWQQGNARTPKSE